MIRIIYTAVAVAACAATCGATGTALGALQSAVPAQAMDSLAAAPQALPGAADSRDARDLNTAQLTALLRDRNPEVRKSAVRAAKRHIQNNYANEPVLELLLSAGERADIRVEAARTLSYAGGYRKVQEALASVAVSAAEPVELRVMSYKALFDAAAGGSRLQEQLCEAVRAEKEPQVRRAAIWALFGSAQAVRVQDALLEAAEPRESEADRIEALKSLYPAVGYPRVKNLYRSLAADAKIAKRVRLVSIKALSGARDSSVERLLEDLVRTESDGELRAAAVAALEPDEAELRGYFHLGYRAQSGVYVSPIEAE